MSERDFIYWLQGFFELSETDALTEEQVRSIKDHIALVLKKETQPLKRTKSRTSPIASYDPNRRIC